MSVDVVTRGAVRIVTINRPERRNAMDPETFVGLGRAFVDAEHDDAVRVVVLTGAGEDAFCSGMDLKAFVAEKREGSARTASGPGTEVFVERVYPKPIVAAVNGAAVAGGLGIMLGCDIVIAADHAVFGLPEVKRGLVGVGATSRATLRLPPAVVLELALTGAPMDATRSAAPRAGEPRGAERRGDADGDGAGPRDRGERADGDRGGERDRLRRRSPAPRRDRAVARARRTDLREQRRAGRRDRLRREARAEIHRHLTRGRICA